MSTLKKEELSSRVREAARPALRQARRVGWAVEDKVDDGIRVVRRNPKTSGAVVLGVVAAVTLAALACRKKR